MAVGSSKNARLYLDKFKLWKLQDKTSNIFELPESLLRDIIGYLPQSDRVFFSQTCLSFQSLAKCNFDARMLNSRQERIEYLDTLTRDSATHWVCGWCVALHPVKYRDTPAESQFHYCPADTTDVYFEGLRRPTYDFSHRHVQLALKYIRLKSSVLNKQQISHLASIMKPTHVSDEMTSNRDFKLNYPAVKRKYCFTPLESKGRMLLHISLVMEPGDTSHHYPYWSFQACPHRFFPTLVYLHFLQAWEREKKEVESRPGAPENLTSLDRALYIEPPAGLNIVMYEAAKTAADKPGETFHDSCPRCLTDFSLAIYRSKGGKGNGKGKNTVYKVVLETWRDLGGECAPWSGDWMRSASPTQCIERRPEYYDVAPGAIRERFMEKSHGSWKHLHRR